jgi:hypothetical protein
MSNLQRSIRLLGRAESSLNSISAKSGEIFYDTTNQTLRVYNQSGPSILATEDYVDTAVNNIDLSGIDLSGLDLTGYATETYVTTRGYITSSALSGYALTSAIPTNNNQLTNGAGFITSSALSDYALTSAIPTNNNQLTNGANYITSSALSDYALTSAIPTNNNQLTNGAGYITSSSLTGLATESFVGTAISNLIDAAPTALNTLNELAAALNNDANFATTVTTALGDKAPINNPTFTGTVGGVTATHVGLGNVTNESKVTMFTNPSFTSNGTNNVMTIDSEGVNIVRGGLELDDSSGTGAGRISFRNSSGPLGYIEYSGQYDLFPNSTAGVGFYTGVGNLGLTLSDNFGVVPRRPIIEPITNILGTGLSSIEFNTYSAAVFRISGLGSNFTANFTNLTTSVVGLGSFSYTAAIIIDQGSTAHLPTAVEINGTAATVLWQGGSAPTSGTASGVDIVSFAILRDAQGPNPIVWTVLGSLTSYS